MIFISLSMILGVILVLALFLPGIRYVRASLGKQPGCKMPGAGELPKEAPKVAIIVPVAGNTPHMKLSLQSLLNQDYPDYEIFFVTRDFEEPATFLVKEVSKGNEKTQHIVAGQTNKCAQKNQNLIAGITAVSPSVEILVFCDSTHLAPPNLISNLVKDIINGEMDMTSGYHRIIPGDSRPATLGMVWTVLSFQLLQGNPFFSQPWGGAMAITREAFEAHRVHQLWARSVVDDVSLGAFMRKTRIKFKTIPGVCLSTPLTNQTFSEWSRWMTRQILYLKFCLPWTWAVATLIMFLLAIPVILSLILVSGGLLGIFDGNLAIFGVGFLTLFTVIGLLARKLMAMPGPLILSMGAFYLFPFIASWCFLKTWFTRTITWKGISYRVDFGGEVLDIISEN